MNFQELLKVLSFQRTIDLGWHLCLMKTYVKDTFSPTAFQAVGEKASLAQVWGSLPFHLSCAVLPWWKLACEKSIKDEFTIKEEFTIKDEFLIEEEIATKVCSNRLHCGMGHPSPCSSCCHLFAEVLLLVWVATPILEFDSELPSEWMRISPYHLPCVSCILLDWGPSK